MAKKSNKQPARKPARKMAQKPSTRAALGQRDPRRSSLETPKISAGFDVGRDNAVDIVDQLDEAVFLLRTIDMAMSNPHEWGEHNEQTMAVSWTAQEAIRKLLAVRNPIYSLGDRARAA
ncbi:hypothetical protein [Hyphomicrobium sp. CS1BSMeth3]|uniref:hypothetical protein n=1 Tax=Hyphomicrobium sp. CS1BSMeth3 TaxID=1892844 RepID=UPI000930924D|nr:hypothetical protein [Hyphomicrobium sp. CS1BSMeth3]